MQEIERFGYRFRLRDKVIQTGNDYEKEVFNGDIGQIASIDPVEREVVVRFDSREVVYDFGELDEISPAYAISIHKSQGSEFPVVVIPLAMQQYMLLERNLIYTAITRGNRLAMVVGEPKALRIAVPQKQHAFAVFRIPRASAGTLAVGPCAAENFCNLSGEKISVAVGWPMPTPADTASCTKNRGSGREP